MHMVFILSSNNEKPRKIMFVGIPQLLVDLANMSNVAEILEG